MAKNTDKKASRKDWHPADIKAELEKAKREFKLHPHQPVGMQPRLSTDLQVDNIVSMSPIKISRRDALKEVVLPDEESASCSASPVLQAAV